MVSVVYFCSKILCLCFWPPSGRLLPESPFVTWDSSLIFIQGNLNSELFEFSWFHLYCVRNTANCMTCGRLFFSFYQMQVLFFLFSSLLVILLRLNCRKLLFAHRWWTETTISYDPSQCYRPLRMVRWRGRVMPVNL